MTEDEYRFMCGTCGERFNELSEAFKHMLADHDINPFEMK